MLKNARYTIWAYDAVDADYIESIRDNFPEASESELIDIAYEDNDFQYDCEMMNLENLETAGDIIIIANLGRWNGRFTAYKELKSTKVTDCFRSEADPCWYVDYNGDLHCEDHDHDATSYYLYRSLRPELSETQIENFLDKIYYGEVTRRDITRYTERIGDKIAEVYGWKVRKSR